MKHILLMLLCAISVSLSAQVNQVPFNGLITDVLDHPVKGAKIYIEKGYSTRSNKKGQFGLTNVLPNDTITIEYQKRIYLIPVDGRKSIKVKIGDQIDNNSIFEAEEDKQLVDWGYGYVKKRESLEVSSGISGEVLRRTGETNLLKALQGKVAGLNISNTNSFGADPSVNIRGINSINLPSTPLYIVDGVEVSTLDFVNVYDVYNVEVLKDGSMYGSKGACGVILVHTIGAYGRGIK